MFLSKFWSIVFESEVIKALLSDRKDNEFSCFS
jgi:hypothetical protein